VVFVSEKFIEHSYLGFTMAAPGIERMCDVLGPQFFIRGVNSKAKVIGGVYVSNHIVGPNPNPYLSPNLKS